MEDMSRVLVSFLLAPRFVSLSPCCNDFLCQLLSRASLAGYCCKHISQRTWKIS